MAGILDSKKDMRLDGALLKTLQQANAGDKWTSTRQSAYEDIDKLINKFNGHVFFSDQRVYGLSTRGSHAVFQVPPSQGRNLKKFRGHLTLIICIGRSETWPGYSGRKFVAFKLNDAGQIIKST